MSALEDEAVSLSYWLAKQLGEHVDDQAGETLTGTVQRLMNGNPANKHEAVRSMGNQERATIYASGYAAGMSRAMRHMSDEPHLSLEIDNPYTSDGKKRTTDVQ